MLIIARNSTIVYSCVSWAIGPTYFSKKKLIFQGENNSMEVVPSYFPRLWLAIGIALVFCIKEIFLRAEHGLQQKGERKGCGPLMCFSTSTRITKTTQLITPTIVVLCCADRRWKAGVIKTRGNLGTKFFRTKLGWIFLKR